MNQTQPKQLSVEYQKKYESIIRLYSDRIKDAETKHQVKFEMILDSRKSLKQVMPEITVGKLMSANTVTGNNVGNETRSKYMPPVMLAIKKKMTEDLTSQAADFEYASNGEGGRDKASKFMDIIKRTFTQKNTNSEYIIGVDHLFGSGTLIAQPVTGKLTEQVIARKKNDDGTYEDFVQTIDSGRYVSFYVYDPLTTLLDPNADPNNVQETSEWIVVTLGKFSPEQIKSRYGVDVSYKQQTGIYNSESSTYLIVDTYKKELENLAGHQKGGIVVREYYTKDGKVYTIIDDYYVVKEKWNDARIAGMIPFVICPAIVDLESPYGIPFCEELRPSVELIATAINAVADNTSIKNKFPWVTIKGLLDRDAKVNFESGYYNKMNSILELNPVALKAYPNISVSSIANLFMKPEIQEVTEGATFLYTEGLNNVWLITGLNPTMLSGRQEKQIRVQSVADIVNQSGLRSSAQVVKNMDTLFFNPMCRAWQTIFAIYYDEFAEFVDAESGEKIPLDIISDKKNIRVVNGSYLPADQMSRMQRAQFLQNTVAQNPYSLDPVKALRYAFESMGFRIEDFERDPLQLFDQRQIMAILESVQQLGPEGFVSMMGNQLQSLNQQQAQQQTQQPQQGGQPQQ